VFEDSRNCNVVTDRALVALEGVDDLVVVATQDAILVSRQKDANGLKRLVARLKAVAPQVTEDHIQVHRPCEATSPSTTAIATRSSGSS
jgi:mannose-1-phosphate guanylyltransferase/mannose-6-phosphate isomerase